MRSGFSRSEFVNMMSAVDVAWSGFEKGYILELMSIEDKARSWLVQAIRTESQLTMMEAQNNRAIGTTKHLRLQQKFIKCLGKLNSVANTHGKGRDDFDADVLERATAVLDNSSQTNPRTQEFANETAQALAKEVKDSFDAMRKYLREVSTCLECVDPHLCKNSGLVSRLVDVEESWELGSLYVQRALTLDALCDWVSQIRIAQSQSADFREMCENCDAEMFLVMPRMIWLCYLRSAGSQKDLMSTLIPNRFGSVADKELQVLCDMFQDILQSYNWETILQMAISGPTNKGDSLASFMLGLESWSMELQRNSPKDWNRCSSVIMQCLTGGQRKERSSEFNV